MTPTVVVLLGLRFLVELGLFAAPTAIGTAALGVPAGLLIGLAGSAAVATVWGLALSPKRRLDLPLSIRVTIELALFGAAGIGLAAVGHGGWGATLVAAELVTLVPLAALGMPPGSDAGASSGPRPDGGR